MLTPVVASGDTPLLAVMVIGNNPAVVGVPDNTPATDRVSPAGSGSAVGTGVPATVNAKLYAVPTVPAEGVPEIAGATPNRETSTLKVRVPGPPSFVLTLHVTRVVPTGNTLPDTGVQGPNVTG